MVKPAPPSPDFLDYLMSEALFEAKVGADSGEVPVGAVLAVGTEIITRAHNLTEKLKSPLAHAELLVLQEASKKLNNWRLEDAVLCVTLEPCTMCTGALIQARIPLVVIGASDSKQGAMGSLYDLTLDTRHPKQIRTIRNVRSEESGQLLRCFFGEKRR